MSESSSLGEQKGPGLGKDQERSVEKHKKQRHCQASEGTPQAELWRGGRPQRKNGG